MCVCISIHRHACATASASYQIINYKNIIQTGTTLLLFKSGYYVKIALLLLHR